MVRIYRKSNLCASIKVAEDGTYTVSARRLSRDALETDLLQRRFNSWAAAARFLEEVYPDW